MTASQVKQYQAKKISCWSNSWGKKLMVRRRPWLLLAVCETRLEEQRPSLVSRPRYASSCRAVVLNFTLFCINWLYTENQTWMFTSSWSERGFDVTSEELLHCLTELVSGKRPCWAECRGGLLMCLLLTPPNLWFAVGESELVSLMFWLREWT